MKILQESIPNILGRFFEGGKIIPTQMPAFLSDVVKIRPVPGAPHDVDLDINILTFKDALFRHGFDLLEAHKYEEGAMAYRTLLELWPRHALSHYNLACAEALLGHSDSAVQSLIRSIDFGYQNLAHMLKDSDLDSIRTHPGYLEVVETLKKAGKKQEVPVVNESESKKMEENLIVKDEIAPISPPIEEKKVEEPIVSVPEPEIKKVLEEPANEQYQSELQLLADMGFADRQMNLLLLLAESGDLANVIHRLFN